MRSPRYTTRLDELQVVAAARSAPCSAITALASCNRPGHGVLVPRRPR
ncbi:hypothetical protein [Methylobacterium sp. E-025]